MHKRTLELPHYLRSTSQAIHAAPCRDLGLAPSLALLVNLYYEHLVQGIQDHSLRLDVGHLLPELV